MVVTVTLTKKSALNSVASSEYFILIVALLFFLFKSTISDPTDPTIKLERDNKQGIKNGFNSENYEFYCNICECHVLENTKHCSSCNRCV
jgi:hypothetical protein